MHFQAIKLLDLNLIKKVIYFFMDVPFIPLFYVCADNSGHLHHVDRLAFFQVCKVSDLA